jgi:16S rRNA (adenine1518-N6/adenine1519-N6)-dimethyltransferase
MTKYLAEAAKSVTAIEVDSELALVLKAENKHDNVEIICADALEVDFAKLFSGRGKIKVVANLPYNISTPVLFKLIENHCLFSELYLLLQKEVAYRISAPAGKKPYGILSVQLQLFADCSIVMNIGPESFSPKPKVDSALIKLAMLDKPRSEVDDLKIFKKTVRAAFAKRRKTIKNSMKSSGFGHMMDEVLAAMEKLEIDTGRRAETLTIEEYANLSNTLAKLEKTYA